MRRNLLLLVLGVSVSALSGSAAARNAAVTNELPFDKCPTAAEARSADNSHYIQLAEAASGAEKRIPKVFRSAPAAGRPFAFQMDSGYRMGIGSLYFANASKFCGVPVAQNSWAFSISIPTAQNASQASFMAFAAKSRNGWRVYGGVQLN
jgi:hypothetical protein